MSRLVAAHPSVVDARQKAKNIGNALAQTQAAIDRDAKELRSREAEMTAGLKLGNPLPEVEIRITELTSTLATLARRKVLLETSVKQADKDRSRTEEQVRESVVAEALDDLRELSRTTAVRLSASVWADMCAHASLMHAIQQVDPNGIRTRPPGPRQHRSFLDAITTVLRIWDAIRQRIRRERVTHTVGNHALREVQLPA